MAGLFGGGGSKSTSTRDDGSGPREADPADSATVASPNKSPTTATVVTPPLPAPASPPSFIAAPSNRPLRGIAEEDRPEERERYGVSRRSSRNYG